MTLLATRRSRIFAATAALAVAAALCLLVTHRLTTVQAAKQAVLAEDAQVMKQIAGDATPHAGAAPVTTPVLVELFTSEGCSSCPPADALLARLLRTQPVPAANILVLEEHVDYWDSLGWRDRFSSHQFTERQSHYVQRLGADDSYTPQMVVDGADQFVGSDSAHALRSIAQAARAPKLALSLSPLTTTGNRIASAISVPPTASSTPADLYAAVVQSMASTRVERGENGGRTLNHVSVLRSLERIGSLADASSGPLKFSLPIPASVSPENLNVIVFAERPNQGPILGAVASSRSATSTITAAIASASAQ